MKKSTLLTLILFLTVSVFSQNNYQKGFFITNQNDTIFGYVKDRKSFPYAQLYKKIRFKKNLKQFFPKKMSPYQIDGYKIGNVEFDSKWIYTRQHFLKIEYPSVPNLGEKVFLKVVIRGYLTYYQREYEDFESDEIDIVDLFKRKSDDYFIRVTQGIFGLKKNKLAKYFIDCPLLGNLILTKQIRTPIEVVNYYNNWQKQKH